MPDVATSSASALHDEFHGTAGAFEELAERALSTGDLTRIPSGEIERVLTAAIKLYAAKAEVEGAFPPPVSAEKITPTEVVLVVSEMLRAANLSLFDLAMWYRRAG